MSKTSKNSKKSLHQKEKNKRSSVISISATLLIFCLFGAVATAFVLSPEVRGVGSAALEVASNVVSDATESPVESSVSCGEYEKSFSFDEGGNMIAPYPVLTDEVQSFCVNIDEYRKFIQTMGTVNVTDEDGVVQQRDISGGDWLSEMIAYEPEKGLAYMLEDVKSSLMEIIPDFNPQFGWVELPGIKGTVDPEPDSTVPQPSQPDFQPDWSPSDSGGGTTPVLVVSTPDPTEEVLADEQTVLPDLPVAPPQSAEPQNWYDSNCDSVLWGSHSIDDLSTMGEIWQMTAGLNLIPGNNVVLGVSIEFGISDKNYKFCVENITGIPTNMSVSYINGIKAFPTYNQLRSKPTGGFVGTGDEMNIFNGLECFVKNMWIGNCSIQKPMPTAVPPGLPTQAPAPQEIKTYASVNAFVNEYLIPSGISIVRYCGTMQGLAGFGDCTSYVNMGNVSSTILNYPTSSWIAHCGLTPVGDRGTEIGSGYCYGPTGTYP